MTITKYFAQFEYTTNAPSDIICDSAIYSSKLASIITTTAVKPVRNTTNKANQDRDPESSLVITYIAPMSIKIKSGIVMPVYIFIAVRNSENYSLISTNYLNR